MFKGIVDIKKQGWLSWAYPYMFEVLGLKMIVYAKIWHMNTVSGGAILQLEMSSLKMDRHASSNNIQWL